MFKEKLTPILQNPIQKIEEEGTLLNLFYEASITVTLKPDQKKNAKKENYRPVSFVKTDSKPFPKWYQIDSQDKKIIHEQIESI